MKVRSGWVWSSLALASGIAAGAAWPPPPLPKIAQSGDTWSLPTAAEIARHTPQDMAQVTQSMRWKGETGDTTGKTMSDWRLAGIVSEDSTAILIMAPSNEGKVQRVGIGEGLPDGSVLHNVASDRITTKRDACITTYQVFQAQAIEKSSGCEEPAAPDQGTRQ